MRPIDADALDIMEYCEEFPNGEEDRGWNAAVRMINDYVQRAPTLDYKDLVPQGEWVTEKEHDDYTAVKCTACGGILLVKWSCEIHKYRHCPNCGARMKE